MGKDKEIKEYLKKIECKKVREHSRLTVYAKLRLANGFLIKVSKSCKHSLLRSKNSSYATLIRKCVVEINDKINLLLKYENFLKTEETNAPLSVFDVKRIYNQNISGDGIGFIANNTAYYINQGHLKTLDASWLDTNSYIPFQHLHYIKTKKYNNVRDLEIGKTYVDFSQEQSSKTNEKTLGNYIFFKVLEKVDGAAKVIKFSSKDSSATKVVLYAWDMENIDCYLVDKIDKI